MKKNRKISLANLNHEEIKQSHSFLLELYNCSKKVINGGMYNLCSETYIEYILFYENKLDIAPALIYEILMLLGWNKYSKHTKDISLRGLAGMCL